MFFMDTCLLVIAEHNMTPDEAAAYKLCCMYEETASKVFPEYLHYRTSAKDPRKTSLFKYCYKLYQETKNKLRPEEYKLYMRAQFDVLKAITRDGDAPLIQPNCIISQTSWNRWLVWKRRYDIKKKQFEEVQAAPVVADHIKIDLTRAKKFLLARMEELTDVNICKSIDKGDMFLWVNRKQVSPYYVLLSPHTKEWAEKTKFQFDLGYYKNNINEDVERFFRTL